MAEGKPVEVIVGADGDPDTPATILTDEVALTSILRNLLSNGIKYTDHGEVRLSVRVTGPRLEISVADTGIGIPAGLHDHVFEEFYQVPGVRRGGTGLGLPYARRLAGILGGDLTLTSEPGRGTTVTFGLPLRTPAVGTVLLADDDAAFRGVVKGLFSGLADRVIEAENGTAALALLAADPVDLVLTDMRMPGMDGTALLARLPASVPAIVVTGADLPPPPRAAAVLRKDELTRERLEFTLRAVIRSEP
jgi:CheY-like chemotaxis protein/anti-sigma regulatory factor (Ser/Thr protein kinase)